jgi:hypothetical protein
MNRATAGIALAICVSACALQGACAAPGDPTARHPVVPAAISNLSTHQSGNAVILTFSLPQQSTDRAALSESPTVEIYRASIPAGAAPDRKAPWRLVYTIPSERADSYLKDGHVEFSDPVTPEQLANAGGSSTAYMVRTRIAQTKVSGDSNFSAVAIHPAPEAPRDLRVAVTESALKIDWSGKTPVEASALTYRVYRSEMEPGQSTLQDLSQAKVKSPAEMVGTSSTLEYFDSHFEFDRTYLYTVRAVTQAGPDSVESNDSAPVMVTPRDTFAPAAPQGLEAAVVPATPANSTYVDLSWGISSEADLAGYYVYRSDREDTTGVRISEQILPSPTFRDISVMAGQRYFYRVTAVDHAGNESSKSSAVQTDVP